MLSFPLYKAHRIQFSVGWKSTALTRSDRPDNNFFISVLLTLTRSALALGDCTIATRAGGEQGEKTPREFRRRAYRREFLLRWPTRPGKFQIEPAILFMRLPQAKYTH